MNKPNCPFCNSNHIWKRDNRKRKKFYVPYFSCKKCKLYFKGKRIYYKQPVYVSKPIPQPNWIQYNKSQFNEKLFFMHLLKKSKQFFKKDFKQITKKGRPQTDLFDIIFCLALKTFTGLSSRRLISDLKTAQQHRFICHVPNFTVLMKYYSHPKTGKLLNKLIQFFAQPLKPLEKNFAIDSSGFSLNQFGRWRDTKYGKIAQKDYLKAHIMIGVKTKIVTAIEISDDTGADISFFESLFDKTNQGFKIKQVLADKAYISRKNLELVVNNNAMPFIPFKKNARKKGKGSIVWSKLFDFYHDNRLEFLESYHQRSNVESTFSMIKTKFGSNLKTKNFTSQSNELLFKILCHNICVLIKQYFKAQNYEAGSGGTTPILIK